jgi:uridine phosphorylase
MIQFPASELLINADGSIFHLHLKPEHLADNVLLVGDPGRVEMIASLMDHTECRLSNREFETVTGTYKGKRLTAISTGIGSDNIDIVLNELDALANIDLENRTEKPLKRVLNIVRIGTCGSLQPDIPVGSFLISSKSIAFDGMLHFYAGTESICDRSFEEAFYQQLNWPARFNRVSVVSANQALIEQIGRDDMVKGVTITANGFYGPQGRLLRIPLAKPDLNALLQSFSFNKYRITNYEMESAAVAGLSSLLGHRAMTVCLVIANRFAKDANIEYHTAMKQLVTTVMDRL